MKAYYCADLCKCRSEVIGFCLRTYARACDRHTRDLLYTLSIVDLMDTEFDYNVLAGVMSSITMQTYLELLHHEV